jgi:hypothetical protein
MLFSYFMNDFEIDPVNPTIIGVTSVFYILREMCFYCKVFVF